MINSLKKIFQQEYVWLSILTIVYFIVLKTNSAKFFYVIIAIGISFYFFQIRGIVDYIEQRNLILIEVLSNIFVGLIVGFSILVLYLPPSEISNFEILIACLNLVNLLLLIHFYMKNKKQYKNTHLVLFILLSLLFFGI